MPDKLYFLYIFQSTTCNSLLKAKVKFSRIAVLTHSQELNSQVQGRCKILMTRLLNTIRNARRVLTTLAVVALLVSSRHPTLLDQIILLLRSGSTNQSLPVAFQLPFQSLSVLIPILWKFAGISLFLPFSPLAF